MSSDNNHDPEIAELLGLHQPGQTSEIGEPQIRADDLATEATRLQRGVDTILEDLYQHAILEAPAGYIEAHQGIGRSFLDPTEPDKTIAVGPTEAAIEFLALRQLGYDVVLAYHSRMSEGTDDYYCFMYINENEPLAQRLEQIIDGVTVFVGTSGEGNMLNRDRESIVREALTGNLTASVLWGGWEYATAETNNALLESGFMQAAFMTSLIAKTLLGNEITDEDHEAYEEMRSLGHAPLDLEDMIGVFSAVIQDLWQRDQRLRPRGPRPEQE